MERVLKITVAEGGACVLLEPRMPGWEVGEVGVLASISLHPRTAEQRQAIAAEFERAASELRGHGGGVRTTVDALSALRDVYAKFDAELGERQSSASAIESAVIDAEAATLRQFVEALTERVS